MHQKRRRHVFALLALLATLSLLALRSAPIRAILEATLVTGAALQAPTSPTPSIEFSAKRRPPILFLQWTKYFASPTKLVSERPPREFFSVCKSRCEITTNRRRLDEAQVVLFHMIDFNARDLPPRRRPEQLYVFRNKESPALFPLANHVPRGFFNATMTYRFDSDFPESYCNRTLGNVESTDVTAGDEPAESSIDYFAQKKPNRIAFMMISKKCGARDDLSGRLAFARALQRHIGKERLAIVGKCTGDTGNCTRVQQRKTNCERRLLREHFFYLALENSKCRDYVTEKLYRALDGGAVPVVNNERADYRLFAPARSYIEAWRFPTVAMLARYMLELSENREAYNRFHAWRRKPPRTALAHVLSMRYCKTEARCRMCDSIAARRHSPSSANERQVIDDVMQWWTAGGDCDTRRVGWHAG